MTASGHQNLDFGTLLPSLQNHQLWEYETGTQRTCRSVADETYAALQAPLDFPPLEAAIVPGDRVAIAVDANVPSIDEVVEGAIRALKKSGAGEIDVVVSDEATDATVAAIAAKAGDQIRVARHECSKRECLRYLGADEEAAPIYLNRWLVDADFVLPIAVGRPLDTTCDLDLTGVFPAFSDARSRRRYLSLQSGDTPPSLGGSAGGEQPAWMLGIQIMISVATNHRGLASQVLAGTPDAIGKQLTPARRNPDDFPPSATLVIASIDGDSQQQSWVNAARAVAAAARYALPEATIVLWSAIAALPNAAAIDSFADSDEQSQGSEHADQEPEQDFPSWNADEGAARTLARVADEHRLLIHCQLDQEVVESMGFAAIDSEEQLTKLAQSFESCGVLRAAQFAGTTID